MAKTFYPSYIPGQWIHYAHHKKKRIRKKYQNRIQREVRRHKADAQTLTFLLANATAKCYARNRHEQPELSKRLATLGGSWCGGYTSTLFALSLLQIRIPDITAPGLRLPEIEIPEVSEETLDAMGELREAFEKLKESLLEAMQLLIDWIAKATNRLFKWARDFWDHLWCENKRWWYMAEHHKKRRIRKKYRNKIRREARRRAGELLEILTADDSEDDGEASDDEEGP